MFPANQFWPLNKPGNGDGTIAVQMCYSPSRKLPGVLDTEIKCSPVSEVLGRASIVTGSSKVTFLQSAAGKVCLRLRSHIHQQSPSVPVANFALPLAPSSLTNSGPV